MVATATPASAAIASIPTVRIPWSVNSRVAAATIRSRGLRCRIAAPPVTIGEGQDRGRYLSVNQLRIWCNCFDQVMGGMSYTARDTGHAPQPPSGRLRSVTIRRRSPTMRRRRLGVELKRLRENAKLTIDEVGTRLGWSDSKMSRIEGGQVAVSPRDVGMLLAIYGVGGDQRDRMLQMATTAQERGWGQAYNDTQVVPLVGLEAEAASMRIYEGLVVPGLFQVREYSAAVIKAVRPDLPTEQSERWVDLRMARRRFLFGRDHPPAIDVVIDEAVVRRPAGGGGGIGRQLRSLADDAALPSVSLRVLPFGAGQHAAMSGAFTVFEFSDADEPDAVYLEQLTRDLYLEDGQEVERYKSVFRALSATAVSQDDPIEMLL